MTFEERLINNERPKNWFKRAVSYWGMEYKSTQLLKDEFVDKPLGVNVTISPSVILKIFIVLLHLVLGLSLTYVFEILIVILLIVLKVDSEYLDSYPFLIGFLLCIFVLYKLIRKKFLIPENSISITLTKEYIEVQNVKYFWSNVHDTYILFKFTGPTFFVLNLLPFVKRHSEKFLLIVLNDGTYLKIPLQFYTISIGGLASYIEYYKKK